SGSGGSSQKGSRSRPPPRRRRGASSPGPDRAVAVGGPAGAPYGSAGPADRRRPRGGSSWPGGSSSPSSASRSRLGRVSSQERQVSTATSTPTTARATTLSPIV